MLVFALLITDFSTVRQKARVFLLIGTDQLVQPLVIFSLDADVRVYLLVSEHAQMDRCVPSRSWIHRSSTLTRVPSKWEGRSTTGLAGHTINVGRELLDDGM